MKSFACLFLLIAISIDAPQSLLLRRQETLPWIWALNGSKEDGIVVASHSNKVHPTINTSIWMMPYPHPIPDGTTPFATIQSVTEGTIYPKHNQSQSVPISCVLSPNTVLHISWSKPEVIRGRKGYYPGLVWVYNNLYTQHTISISNKLRQIIPLVK